MEEVLKIGQKFIGKLKNEYFGKIIEIDEQMLYDNENTCQFLHYYGFKEISEIDKLVNDPNVLNIYPFGSRIYGTIHENSDYDYIIVTENKVISDNINHHYYTVAEFQNLLDLHDIQMLECYFLQHKYILKLKHNFIFNLDNSKLRTSISTISSNSWVKGKKKLIVTGDYDKMIALKSIFHSLRILDFGTQIAATNQIKDYSSMNHVFYTLMELSKDHDRVELWEKIETKFKKYFNTKSSEFKQLCPKDLTEKTLKDDLIKLFQENDCYDQKVVESDLIDLIINLVKK